MRHARARASMQLNARYGGGRFFLFHRERRWNASEGRWMGWERKRGKLVEFNRLLRGATDTSFIVVHGDLAILPSIRFVITLDSDTQLPMDAARAPGRHARASAEPAPLRSCRSAASPRATACCSRAVGVDLVSANRSVFAKVFSGHVGVDPYTTAVSDVYQDLFHEGSYVGKGIYDVDAFEAALANRVPENTLLSHDLFEGSYARAGLSTDIQLVDDYPAHYLAFAARQHRWARGDWQIARWLWRTVPDATRPDGPQRAAGHRALEDPRQPAPQPARAGADGPARWRVGRCCPGRPLLWTVLGAARRSPSRPTRRSARSLSSRVRGVPIAHAHRRRARATSSPARGSRCCGRCCCRTRPG